MSLMQNRRQVLRHSLVLPFAKHSHLLLARTDSSECDIISDASCLSVESLSGFRSVHAGDANVIIVAGVQSLAPVLAKAICSRVNRGSWLVWDQAPHFVNAADLRMQAKFLNASFGVTMGDPTSVSCSELYVRYSWPVPCLVRTFLTCTPVFCLPNEVIASYGNMPVALRRPIGRGGIVFLGSMLGPQLKAGDREAHQLATGMLLPTRSSSLS